MHTLHTLFHHACTLPLVTKVTDTTHTHVAPPIVETSPDEKRPKRAAAKKPAIVDDPDDSKDLEHSPRSKIKSEPPTRSIIELKINTAKGS